VPPTSARAQPRPKVTRSSGWAGLGRRDAGPAVSGPSKRSPLGLVPLVQPQARVGQPCRGADAIEAARGVGGAGGAARGAADTPGPSISVWPGGRGDRGFASSGKKRWKRGHAPAAPAAARGSPARRSGLRREPPGTRARRKEKEASVAVGGPIRRGGSTKGDVLQGWPQKRGPSASSPPPIVTKWSAGRPAGCAFSKCCKRDHGRRVWGRTAAGPAGYWRMGGGQGRGVPDRPGRMHAGHGHRLGDRAESGTAYPASTGCGDSTLVTP